MCGDSWVSRESTGGLDSESGFLLNNGNAVEPEDRQALKTATSHLTLFFFTVKITPYKIL